MKKILIIKVSSLVKKGIPGVHYVGRSSLKNYDGLYLACLVICKSSTHFRCVVNRWDVTDIDEKIPNFLLPAYIMKYKDNFTTEEIIESIL